ncbi:MAG TPA: hypothetical protein VK034_05445, partial [Enhygromyxa sp.]|nr:hypothetical protein [Enhygromyxa sp.]
MALMFLACGHTQARPDSSAARSAVGEPRVSEPSNAEPKQDPEPSACPPADRFESVDAYCEALKIAHSRDSELAEQDFDCRLVDEDFELEVEGTGPGELLVVEEQDPDGLPYWTHHLLLRRDGMLEPLGRIGTNVGRGCSVGFVEIEQARWLTGADVRLVVELHAEGEYSCYESSPWDDCIAAAQEAGKPESTCDG